MFEVFPRLKRLRPAQNEAEAQKLAKWEKRLFELAKADGHDVIAPTDLIMKGDDVLGYVSIANIPIIIAHYSTQHLKARDSFNITQVCEQRVEGQGYRSVIWPIGVTSPFHTYFPDMGYRRLANVDLFVKEFSL